MGYWGYGQYQQRQQLETYLGNKYQQAFYEMVENVEQIQVLLGKTVVANTPRQKILNLSSVWKESMSAQSELTQLPISEKILFRTAKYLSQTGDYAHVLAKKNAEGKVLNDKNYEQLINLREQAAQLSNALHEVENRVLKGNVKWSEIVRGTKYQIKKEKLSNLGQKFDDIQEDLNKYPTLIYNGPFSDHISKREPKGVTGDKVSKKKAQAIAKKAISSQNGKEIKVVDSDKISSKIPAFNFKIKQGDENYSVDISNKGGHLVNMISSQTVASKNISLKQASQKASKYLESIGYPEMHPTYGEIKDNIAYISFAFKPEDIIYYPDIIDIQVALDNGEVIAVESLSYLVSHHNRDVAEPKISKQEAKDLVTNKLDDIKSIRLAVIPTAGGGEVLTYEVRGNLGKEKYLIYVNAETGVEEEILKLVRDKNGSFTI